MRRVLAQAARLMASVFALLFVLVTLIVLLLFTAEQQLLSARTYQRALAQQNIYARFPALAAEQVVYQMDYAGPGIEDAADSGSGPPEQFRYLAQSDYEAIIADLAPADWLQSQTEQALEGVFASLDGQAGDEPVAISFVDLKARLTGDVGMDAALRLVHSWPPCTAAELGAWSRVQSVADVQGLPVCRPPDRVIESARPMLEAYLDGQAAFILDEAQADQILGGADPAAEPAPSGLEEADVILGRARTVIHFSPLLLVLLILLVTLCVVRSLKGFLRWCGIPIMIAGLLGIVVALAATPAMDSVLAANADRLPAALAPTVWQAIVGVARNVLRSMMTWLGAEAWLVWLVGFAMLWWSFFLKPPGEAPEAPPASETAPA